MDDKVIKVEGNLLRLYASLLPNIVKLLDMNDMKELDIRKSSVHNYICYLEICYAYKNGLMDYNAFLANKEMALQNKLMRYLGNKASNNLITFLNYIPKSLHLGYTLNTHILFIDDEFKNYPLMKREIKRVTIDTINYNKAYLDYYIRLIMETNYRDGDNLDYLCSQLIELYANLLEIKVNELSHPLITCRYDWDDMDCTEVQLDIFTLIRFGFDVITILNNNKDKLYIKEIKKELMTAFTKHKMLFTIMCNKIDKGDFPNSNNIPEYYDKCLEELNNNSIAKMNSF